MIGQYYICHLYNLHLLLILLVNIIKVIDIIDNYWWCYCSNLSLWIGYLSLVLRLWSVGSGSGPLALGLWPLFGPWPLVCGPRTCLCPSSLIYIYSHSHHHIRNNSSQLLWTDDTKIACSLAQRRHWSIVITWPTHRYSCRSRVRARRPVCGHTRTHLSTPAGCNEKILLISLLSKLVRLAGTSNRRLRHPLQRGSSGKDGTSHPTTIPAARGNR